MRLYLIFCTSTVLLLHILTRPILGSTEASKSDPKNILFYLGCGSYSMRISVWPLVQALSDKGHHVTFLSAYKSKTPHPKIVDFVPKHLEEWWAKTEHELNVFELRKNGMLIPFWFTAPQFGVDVCTKMYEDPEVVQWIKSSKFDLVVIDSFFNDCAFGMAHVFKAKTIVFSTTTAFPWFYGSFGIPDDSSWAGADTVFTFSIGGMNLIQRATNAFLPVLWTWIRELWYFPKLEEITKRGLKLDSVPSFADMERNTSLTFITTHYSQEFARAYPPNVVPVGGLAVTGNQEPLPAEIQEFIKKGKDGFIYISFGTVGEFSQLDEEIREAFIDAVLKFPNIRFIWKSAKGLGVTLPENFLVLKWAPQQSLLAHPNIKAFVTHAGLGGINEAIYYGVPMIAFPMFAEQDYNAKHLEAKGIGYKLEITELKADQLEKAIKGTTENSRMKETMLKVSKLFRNRPQSALETSLWWTEFVLQHDSSELTEFLRPLNVHQYWWTRRQLDAWMVIIITMLLVTSILLYILKFLICIAITKLFKREGGSTVEKKKIKRN